MKNKQKMNIRRLLLAVVSVLLVFAVVGRLAGRLGAADEQAPLESAKSDAHGKSESKEAHGAGAHAHEHDPFEEVVDNLEHWQFFENEWFHLSIPLPPFLSKF